MCTQIKRLFYGVNTEFQNFQAISLHKCNGEIAALVKEFQACEIRSDFILNYVAVG